MTDLKPISRWFTPRETGNGTPASFDVQTDHMLITRGASTQRIETDDGLGAIALCTTAGEVLGYGTVAIDELAALADAMGCDTTPGRSALERLAASGLALVLPLDAMPGEVRDLFLAESVDPGLVDMGRLTDQSIAQAQGHHDHPGHIHLAGEECDACVVEAIERQVEEAIAQSGHAVIVIPDGEGQVSYTVGLAEAGWPELVMSGIPGHATLVLNGVVRVLRESERRPKAGMRIDKAISVPVRLRAVDGAGLAPIARKRAQRMGQAAPELLQVTWPDADGYHPGDRRYDDVNLPQALL